MMDSGLLQTLLVVAEEGSYTRAGERAGLTQQAISAQVKRLEIMLGRSIIDRTGHGIKLTPNGEALIAYAKQFEAISNKISRHFSAAPLAGSVRVGILEGFASTGLPGVLSAVRAIQPNLEIIVETASTDTLVARLEQDRLDLVLGLQRERGSRGETIGRHDVLWFGDATAYADPTVPVRLVTYPEPSLPRSIALEALTAAGRSFIIVFESNSRTSLRAAALAGLGVVPFCALFAAGVSSDAAEHLPPLGSAELFLRVGRHRSQAVDVFADFMKRHVIETLREDPNGL